jgi:hypothetical protein
MGLASGVVGETEIRAHEPIEGALGGGVQVSLGVRARLDLSAELEFICGFEARPPAGLV